MLLLLLAAAAVYVFDVAFAAVKLRLNFDKSYMASVISGQFVKLEIGLLLYIVLVGFSSYWIFRCFNFPFILFVLFFKPIYTLRNPTASRAEIIPLVTKRGHLIGHVLA